MVNFRLFVMSVLVLHFCSMYPAEYKFRSSIHSVIAKSINFDNFVREFEAMASGISSNTLDALYKGIMSTCAFDCKFKLLDLIVIWNRYSKFNDKDKSEINIKSFEEYYLKCHKSKSKI